MTDKILVEIANDYILFDLREEFVKDIKKDLRYLKWKMKNEKYKINKNVIINV